MEDSTISRKNFLESPVVSDGDEFSFETIRQSANDNTILLSLCDEIARVRDKDGLLRVINSKLKELFYFSHSMIALIDRGRRTYKNFLVDPDANIKKHPEYESVLKNLFRTDDAVMSFILGAEDPVILELGEYQMDGDVPPYIRVNYESGMKEMLCAILKGKAGNIGYIALFSDKADSFDLRAAALLKSFTPLLTTAVANILINIEIEKKEKEQAILLHISNKVAAVRSKSDLFPIVNDHLKGLFAYDDWVVSVLNEDKLTHSAYVYNEDEVFTKYPGCDELAELKFNRDDGIFDPIIRAEGVIVFELEEIAKLPQASVYVPFWLKHGMTQLIGVPLVAGKKPIGSFSFYTKKRDPIPEENFDLLMGICSQIAIAIENILTNEAIGKKEREQEILLHISKEVASVRYKTDLFPIVNDHLKKLFSYDDGVICVLGEDKLTHGAFLYNPEEVFAKYPGCEQLAEMRFNRDDGIFDPIMATKSVKVFELEEIFRLPNHAVYIPFWLHQGMTQLIGVPLVAGNKPLGTFSFYTKQRNPISEENFDLLLAICSQIAIAIENILTNEDIEKREKEKSILLSFSNDIVTIRDREGLRTVFKKYLSRHFQINEYIITINNEDGETYSYLLHDSPAENPTDKGLEIITGAKMPIKGSLTGAVLGADDPVVFNIEKIVKSKAYSFPASSFWENAGAENIKGRRLKAADKDIGILWTQPGKINERLLSGISAQIAIAIANVVANEKIEKHLLEISQYKLKLEQENNYLLGEIQGNSKYGEIIGSGPEMQKVYLLMSQVAFANSAVLLQGETGTGKELIARAIHNGSPRKSKLMVKVNCAALPASLIESELFGHERGSFTGATERRLGKFELAHNSTLFLDEIGEMPLDLQVKLLRALQEKEIERVGGKGTIKVDVRIIAATNRDLQQEVLDGKFRKDLYYRLNVFPITLPPLRDRLEDIPLLTAHFIERLSRSTGKKIVNISQKALSELLAYNWPGNVRELEHLLERSILLTNGNTIKEIYLPVTERKELMNSVTDDFVKSLEDNERDYILSVLRKCNGKIFGFGGAAERLNIPASTLNSKIIKLGIKKDHLFRDKEK